MGPFLLLLCCALFSVGSTFAAPSIPRIVNGTDTAIASIPFQVSLQFYNMHTCGGAILNQHTIITAAHCLDYMTEHHTLSMLSVRVGSSYLQREGTVYNLSQAIVHELYEPNSYDYDVALLKLRTPLVYTNAVQPLMLGTDRTHLADNEMVQVSGWGRLHTGGPLAQVLQRIEFPVLPQGECEALFGRINKITDRMFCAGFLRGEGDSCSGDSGGPLVNQNNVLYGLVSWGPAECAIKGYTGVYTDVTRVHDWIMEHW